MPKPIYWTALPCIGFTAGCIVGLFIGQADLVYSYQTLITGIMALAAAIATIHELRKQTQQSQKIENERLERKVRASRAQMNDAISALISYTEECFNALYITRTNLPRQLPPPPTEQTQIFKNALEYLDGETADAVFEFVTTYQTHRARIEGWLNRNSHSNDYEWQERVLDTAELNWLATRMFDYARNKSPAISCRAATVSEMMSALRSTVTTPRYYQISEMLSGVSDIIHRRYS